MLNFQQLANDMTDVDEFIKDKMDFGPYKPKYEIIDNEIRRNIDTKPSEAIQDWDRDLIKHGRNGKHRHIFKERFIHTQGLNHKEHVHEQEMPKNDKELKDYSNVGNKKMIKYDQKKYNRNDASKDYEEIEAQNSPNEDIDDVVNNKDVVEIESRHEFEPSKKPNEYMKYKGGGNLVSNDQERSENNKADEFIMGREEYSASTQHPDESAASHDKKESVIPQKDGILYFSSPINDRNSLINNYEHSSNNDDNADVSNHKTPYGDLNFVDPDYPFEEETKRPQHTYKHITYGNHHHHHQYPNYHHHSIDNEDDRDNYNDHIALKTPAASYPQLGLQENSPIGDHPAHFLIRKYAPKKLLLNKERLNEEIVDDIKNYAENHRVDHEDYQNHNHLHYQNHNEKHGKQNYVNLDNSFTSVNPLDYKLPPFPHHENSPSLNKFFEKETARIAKHVHEFPLVADKTMAHPSVVMPNIPDLATNKLTLPNLEGGEDVAAQKNHMQSFYYNPCNTGWKGFISCRPFTPNAGQDANTVPEVTHFPNNNINDAGTHQGLLAAHQGVLSGAQPGTILGAHQGDILAAHHGGNVPTIQGVNKGVQSTVDNQKAIDLPSAHFHKILTSDPNPPSSRFPGPYQALTSEDYEHKIFHKPFDANDHHYLTANGPHTAVAGTNTESTAVNAASEVPTSSPPLTTDANRLRVDTTEALPEPQTAASIAADPLIVEKEGDKQILSIAPDPPLPQKPTIPSVAVPLPVVEPCGCNPYEVLTSDTKTACRPTCRSIEPKKPEKPTAVPNNVLQNQVDEILNETVDKEQSLMSQNGTENYTKPLVLDENILEDKRSRSNTNTTIFDQKFPTSENNEDNLNNSINILKDTINEINILMTSKPKSSNIDTLNKFAEKLQKVSDTVKMADISAKISKSFKLSDYLSSKQGSSNTKKLDFSKEIPDKVTLFAIPNSLKTFSNNLAKQDKVKPTSNLSKLLNAFQEMGKKREKP